VQMLVGDGRGRKDHERRRECSWSFGRVARVLGVGVGEEEQRAAGREDRQR